MSAGTSTWQCPECGSRVPVKDIWIHRETCALVDEMMPQVLAEAEAVIKAAP